MVNLLGRRDGGSEVDYTVNPQIGFPAITGPGDSALPSNHVFPAWDAIAGNMIATALLAALRHRDRHGVGQLVTLALKDVGLAMLGHLGMIAEVQVNDEDRARYGNHLFGAFGCDFATRDGRRAMVVGLTDLQWSTPGQGHRHRRARWPRSAASSAWTWPKKATASAPAMRSPRCWCRGSRRARWPRCAARSTPSA